jgi:hypothetical protein
MELFSRRYGLKPKKTKIQKDDIDEDLRNSLWSMLKICYWDTVQYSRMGGWVIPDDTRKYIQLLWLFYFKKPIDTIPNNWEGIFDLIRNYYFQCKWDEVYDFIEFTANNYPNDYANEKFRNSCNSFLETELSGYRFVGKLIVPLTSKEEIEEVEKALVIPIDTVAQHIKRSIELFSDKTNPDYRNSIKESISGVEAMCQKITKNPKATLGDALKLIPNLHPALKEAYSKLYGYTNDSDGIRHALQDKTDLNVGDARYFLVVCSAFINYLETIK